ncbi:MAG: hypothetical protein R3Y53_09005 [Bacillota bacterium]
MQFTVCSLQFTVYSTAHCLLPLPLPTAYCPLPTATATANCSLPTSHCPL